MRLLKYFIVIAVFFPCIVSSVEAKKIMAGYDGFGEDNLKNFSENGINTHFRSLRIASKLDLKLNSQGQVVLATQPEEWKSLNDYCKKAEKYGIDIYLVAGFHQEHLEQLEKLGK